MVNITSITNIYRASRVEILVYAKALNTRWYNTYYRSLVAVYIDFKASGRRELGGARDKEAKFYKGSKERILRLFKRLCLAEIYDLYIVVHFPLDGGLEDRLLKSYI